MKHMKTLEKELLKGWHSPHFYCPLAVTLENLEGYE